MILLTLGGLKWITTSCIMLPDGPRYTRSDVGNRIQSDEGLVVTCVWATSWDRRVCFSGNSKQISGGLFNDAIPIQIPTCLNSWVCLFQTVLEITSWHASHNAGFCSSLRTRSTKVPQEIGFHQMGNNWKWNLPCIGDTWVSLSWLNFIAHGSLLKGDTRKM